MSVLSDERKNRLLGALWGAVTGDALGVPVEFLSREIVRRNPVTGMRGRGTHNQPAGTWSDDSSLLLCSVESLTVCGQYDPADLAKRFVRWESEGLWTPHGSLFDIGIATRRAIYRLAQRVAPEEAGGDDVNSNGNGSLMRILPIGLWFSSANPEELALYAQRASSLTHRHPRSQMACAFYCWLVVELLYGASPKDAVDATVAKFRQRYNDPPYAAERMHFGILEGGKLAEQSEDDIASSGYVIHTLVASVWCLLTSHSFEETVLKAVNLGEDTYTTGTVAGGLAGACYGVGSIPPEWRATLARNAELALLFAQFSASHCPTRLATGSNLCE